MGQTDGSEQSFHTAFEEGTSETAASAPMARKTRVRKTIANDVITELRNSEISRWNTDYLDNMADIVKSRLKQRIAAQAKKNAEWLIWGRGIANIGRGIGYHCLPSPLNIFCGDSLYEMVTGKTRDGTPRKRSGSKSPDQNERRVRVRRSDQHEISRDGNFQFNADDQLIPLAADEEVEALRAASQELRDDISSALPWNTPSVQASVRSRSVTGSMILGLPESLHSRRHRTASVSPLLRRGTSTLGIDPLQEEDATPMDIDPADEFERYGPSTFVDTQTAEQSQWLRAVLDAESKKFLSFVDQGIQRKNGAPTNPQVVHDSILFEELLPPTQNRRVVAAQGFLHVLSLATKNLLAVHQHGHLGRIELSLL